MKHAYGTLAGWKMSPSDSWLSVAPISCTHERAVGAPSLVAGRWQTAIIMHGSTAATNSVGRGACRTCTLRLWSSGQKPLRRMRKGSSFARYLPLVPGGMVIILVCQTPMWSGSVGETPALSKD